MDAKGQGRAPLGVVLPVAAEKGGVGKTSLVFQIGYELAEHHQKKVLLIDNDHQGHLLLGFYGRTDNTPDADGDVEIPSHFLPPVKGSADEYAGVSLTRNLYSEYTEGELSGFPAAPHNRQPNLHLLAGGDSLVQIDRADTDEAVSNFYRHVSDLRKLYDFILIDNNPSLGNKFMSALICGVFGGVVIPFQAEAGAFGSIDKVLKRLAKIEDHYEASIPVAALILNRLQYGKPSGRVWMDRASKKYGDLILQTALPDTDHVRQAFDGNEWIGHSHSNRPVKNKLRRLTNELLERVG